MDEQGNGQDGTSGAADDGDGGSGDPRFDALARRAGQALRRPAPAHGIDDVRRGRRRQQLVRVGVGGVACLVLALGAVAITAASLSAVIVNVAVNPRSAEWSFDQSERETIG